MKYNGHKNETTLLLWVLAQCPQWMGLTVTVLRIFVWINSVVLPTWAYGITPDLISNIINGNRFSETNNSCLGCSIHTAIWNSFNAWGHRRNINNVTSNSFILPNADTRFTRAKHTLNIDIKTLVPIFLCCRLYCTNEDKAAGNVHNKALILY